MLNGTGEGSIDTLTDLIGNEEELTLLRQKNQALRERADVLEETTHMLEETTSSLREQIDLKDQLIAVSQRETMLLMQQVQEMQEQLEKDGYGDLISSSSVRFSHLPKSLGKK